MTTRLRSKVVNAPPLDVEPEQRLRRLRRQPVLRDLIREHHLQVNDLIAPLFVKHGKKLQQPIDSMPGQWQWSVDQLATPIKRLKSLGVQAVLLFGIPAHKDKFGRSAMDPKGIIPRAMAEIKRLAPDMLLIADLCFCEYTSHGHCGVLHHHPRLGLDVDNDYTLSLLAQQAVVLAQAGADVIAPSGMMDGMVAAIRAGLDGSGHINVPIMSYAVKYASALYGPFREAAEGAPQHGDRRSYQLDPANAAEGLREAEQDVVEGADMLIVKPAGSYLDMIQRVKQEHPSVPLAGYQVSGEYAMIKAAAAQGWLDEKRVALESLLAIKRAGADMIISYYAADCAAWLQARK